jgi:hypothetical protein
MGGWRCRAGSRPPRRTPFPEPTPPGLNHLVVTGTLAAPPLEAESPRDGDAVTLLRLTFPVRDPDRPQDLWTWASCEVEVPRSLAVGHRVEDLQVGAPVLAGGQLSERDIDEHNGRRGVILAGIVHPGDPPPDYPPHLFVVGDD